MRSWEPVGLLYLPLSPQEPVLYPVLPPQECCWKAGGYAAGHQSRACKFWASHEARLLGIGPTTQGLTSPLMGHGRVADKEPKDAAFLCCASAAGVRGCGNLCGHRDLAP